MLSAHCQRTLSCPWSSIIEACESCNRRLSFSPTSFPLANRATRKQKSISDFWCIRVYKASWIWRNNNRWVVLIFGEKLRPRRFQRVEYDSIIFVRYEPWEKIPWGDLRFELWRAEAATFRCSRRWGRREKERGDRLVVREKRVENL